ncbi:primosomal protein N' [Clostridia bacterium]|nr:primosomal protein N' [Clostridia bacterium]
MTTKSRFASVIIDAAASELDRIFSYEIPENLDLQVGSRVIVPFGRANRRIEGYVIGFSDSVDIPYDKVKQISLTLDDTPVFTPQLLELAKFMQEKYFSALSVCLACVIPVGIKMRNFLTKTKQALTAGIVLPKTPLQKKVFEYVSEYPKSFAEVVRAKTGVSSAVISSMIKNGALAAEDVTVRRVAESPNLNLCEPLALNPEQQNAFDFILEKIQKGDTKPTLIYGVTGSGKTEIYLQLIQRVISQGKTAIMLVPEISLTPQTVDIFTKRFGGRVAVTHSRLSAGERFDRWDMARRGEVSVIIGPRSAVFAPFTRIGIIIIDEEHENSYKSEHSPKYHAKEIAEFVAAQHGAQLVLGSATPSLETFFDVKNAKLDCVILKERINKTMPEIFVEDMRRELIEGNRSIFSRALYDAIKDTLSRREQVILFLNRRGHSTFVSCRNCGYVMSCDDCSVNYTYHQYENLLMCHYCGKVARILENCPACGSRYIKYFGIGTEKVQEETAKFFPKAATLRMDADTTSRKNSHEDILSAFRRREADILIGTQMIAKGLDYPNVTLVGVMCADISLNNGDFRSSETTFRLLTQVAGRAGRASAPGKVFIQTYFPEHYAVEFSKNHDYDGFYEHEISVRRSMNYPPFTKIFGIMFVGADEKNLIVLLYRLSQIMTAYNKNNMFGLIGPSPAAISKIKNNYRHKLIVKSEDEDKLRAFVLFCVGKLKETENTSNVEIFLTPNPLNTQ